MIGLSVLFDSSGKSLRDELISAFSNDSDMPGCKLERYQPASNLWIQNVYRPVTAAPGGVVCSPGGQVHLLFHGEVYNCRELAEYLREDKSAISPIADGPRLVALGLEHHGLSFVERINGSFILAAWYPHDNTFYVANDRFGLRPHYYGWCGETLIISPTVRAIHETWTRDTKLDRQGVVEFFFFEQLLGNRTMIEGISVVPPASVCHADNGTLNVNQYWDFPYPENLLNSPQRELCEEMQRLLSIAVNRRLPACCPIGVPLSGGLDSRVLSGIASRSISHLPVFTFGNDDCMDRRFSSQVAHRIGAKHHCASPESVAWEDNFRTSVILCDGMSPVLHAHILLLSSILTKEVGVVLDGLAGDMIVGGYVERHMIHSATIPNTISSLLTRKYFSRMSSSMIDRLFIDKSFSDCVPRIRDTLFTRAHMCCSSRIADVCDYLAYRERVRRFTINGNTLLRNYVEVRAPFFDYDFIDFTMSLPLHLRFRKQLYKSAIRNMFPELKDIGHTPLGNTLDSPFSMAAILHNVTRPDMVIRRLFPSSLKAPVRHFLGMFFPKMRHCDSSVSYTTIFGADLATMFPAFNDANRGWKCLTSYDSVEEMLSRLSRDKSINEAVTLSLWLTFQMYRELTGVET